MKGGSNAWSRGRDGGLIRRVLVRYGRVEQSKCDSNVVAEPTDIQCQRVYLVVSLLT